MEHTFEYTQASGTRWGHRDTSKPDSEGLPCRDEASPALCLSWGGRVWREVDARWDFPQSCGVLGNAPAPFLGFYEPTEVDLSCVHACGVREHQA